jgi:hypothetical protein
MLLEEAGYCQELHDDTLAAIKAKMPMSTADVIREVAGLYERHYGVSPSDINKGMCEDFSTDVLTVIGRGEVFWADDMLDGSWEEHGAHAFFWLDGKYYDSESPEGVDDWKHLSFFTRQ